MMERDRQPEMSIDACLTDLERRLELELDQLATLVEATVPQTSNTRRRAFLVDLEPLQQRLSDTRDEVRRALTDYGAFTSDHKAADVRSKALPQDRKDGSKKMAGSKISPSESAKSYRARCLKLLEEIKPGLTSEYRQYRYLWSNGRLAPVFATDLTTTGASVFRPKLEHVVWAGQGDGGEVCFMFPDGRMVSLTPTAVLGAIGLDVFEANMSALPLGTIRYIVEEKRGLAFVHVPDKFEGRTDIRPQRIFDMRAIAREKA